jgi:hypothetical protein
MLPSAAARGDDAPHFAKTGLAAIYRGADSVNDPIPAGTQLGPERGISPLEPEQAGSGMPPPEPAVADALTLTITGLPRGTVRNGAVILHPGDHIAPADLSGLTFWPEAGFNGPAGKLSYTIDSGRGGFATGSMDVETGVAAGLLAPPPDTVIWESVRNSNDPAEFEGFVRQFPGSPFSAEAKRRLAEFPAAAGKVPP